MEPILKLYSLPEPAPLAGPITEAERIVTLDVLRGFALFGILIVNMPAFAWPLMRSVFDSSLAQAPAGEQATFLFNKLFFEYKFVSLFSLLFGMGFVVQLTRSGGCGAPFRALYLRRIGLLAVIGLAHALLLWHGDILLFYAVIALALLRWGSLPARALLRRAGAFMLVAACLSAFAMLGQYAGTQAAGERTKQAYAEAERVVASGKAPAGFEAMRRAGFDPTNPIWLDAETRAYREGPLPHAFVFRAASYGLTVGWSLFGFSWHILAMFLLGAAAMKSGLLLTEKRAWHKRLVFFALPVGLLLETAHAWSYFASGYNPSLGMAFTSALHEIGSVLTMLGYTGLICLAVHGGVLVRLTGAMAAAGRMALTVYLSQTVIATGIMYWWGLGMFGSFSRVWLIGLAATIYTFLVAACVLWLRVARFGPVEWLWRGLTYRKWQPLMGKQEAANRVQVLPR